MTDCNTPSCPYPTPVGGSAFICRNCQQQMRRDLGDIPALIEDLHTTLSRQDRVGASAGRRASETALPWKQAASEALWVLTNTVTNWWREFDDQPVPDAPIAAARWLLSHTDIVAGHPEAGQVVDECGAMVQLAYEVIDRPPELLLAGQCGEQLEDGGECVAYLYARPDARTVTCRTCGAERSVEDRRAWMVEYASELHLPAVTCLAWVKLLMGKAIPRGTFDGWVHKHHRLVSASHDHGGVALYRFGDVRDLAAEWVARPRKDKAA